MDTKPVLRERFQHIRSSLSPADRRQANAAICLKTVHLPQVRSAAAICCYVSYSSEVDTHQIIDILLKENKTVCVPKAVEAGLKLYRINALSDCEPGFRGIPEAPQGNPEVSSQRIDVFIVPGLAFDPQGYRLGYGKGYYDRLLGDTPGLKIGVAYTNQLIYELPHTQSDVPLDLVITDTISMFTNQ